MAQAVPSLELPALKDTDDEALYERAFILGYGPGCTVARGEGNLRRLAMVCGILPASEAEVHELELVGF